MHSLVCLHRFLKLPAVALCALWLLCRPAPGFAGGIAVLTRDDIVPYNIFVKAFVEAAAQETDVRTFPVHGLNETELRRTVEQIAGLAPSLLVCVGSNACGFAHEHFSALPCVCAMVANPARAQPDAGPRTAFLRMDVSPHEKLAALKRILPGARRVGAVYDPQQCADQVQLLQEAASRMGIDLEARPVSSTKMAIHELEDIMQHVDALVMLYDKTVLAPQSLEQMYILSFRHRVPVVGLSEKYVRLGALCSLDIDIADLGRTAWPWARRCMRAGGACAGVQYPEARWSLYLNATIGPKMGIEVPEQVLQKAVLVE